MTNVAKHDANFIKTLLIDFFLLQYNDVIIGSEVMYGTEKKLADILLLRSNRITAFEIKSKYDTFTRLESQIKEYCKVFNYVYLVIDHSHIKKIEDINLPNNIGIFVLTDLGELSMLKKATLQQNLIKEELLYTINVNFIKTHYCDIKGDSREIRLHISKRSIKKIEDLQYLFLKTRIEPRFNTFLSQRGVKTHTDDLFLLSFPNKEIL